MADFDLQSLLICPDRQLAAAFLDTVAQTRAFRILGDLQAYPVDQALEMRLRQLEPDVVLLDLASDPARAAEITARIVHSRPGTQVVGLHVANQAEALMACLRNGASEFLYAPFSAEIQREAITRIRRLLRPRAFVEREAGRVICVASAKSGCGSTTLALELALALEKLSAGRVLLIDGDLAGGTLANISDSPESTERISLVEVLNGAANANWHRQTVRVGPIELLPAPTDAYTQPLDLSRLHEAIDAARLSYAWVVLDLPIIPERLSLMAASLADVFFLVTTGELPSLHLGRRALGLLQSLGFPKKAVRILVNRMSKRDGLAAADLEKIFGTRIAGMLPQDYQSIHRRSAQSDTATKSLDGASELGKAVLSIAGQLKAGEIKMAPPAEPQMA